MTARKNTIIEANTAFYTAFSQADTAKMAAVWSERPDISVIHPGHGLLQGRQSVMASWDGILSARRAFSVSCCNAEIFQQDHLAYVVCNEILPGHTLIATNIYRLEAGAWKLIHHQAGPAPDIEPSEALQRIH